MPVGVTPGMLACFRMVVSKELAKRDSGVGGAGAGVTGAGASSSEMAHRNPTELLLLSGVWSKE